MRRRSDDATTTCFQLALSLAQTKPQIERWVWTRTTFKIMSNRELQLRALTDGCKT